MFGFRKKKPADTFWDNAGEPYILIKLSEEEIGAACKFWDYSLLSSMELLVIPTRNILLSQKAK